MNAERRNDIAIFAFIALVVAAGWSLVYVFLKIIFWLFSS